MYMCIYKTTNPKHQNADWSIGLNAAPSRIRLALIRNHKSGEQTRSNEV